MARKSSTLEHPAEQTYYEDEHPDEQTAGKQAEKYPGANQREDWSKNEVRENLMEQLDGQAKAALKYNHKLADYDDTDRRNIIDSVAAGFNKLEFNNDKERSEAARETAAAVFKPFYQEIELHELQDNSNFSPGVLKALEAEGVKHVRYDASAGKLEGNQIHEIYLKVDDMETARRIIDRTGGMASVVSREKLEGCEREFASTLYDSRPGDPDSYAKLHEIIKEAIGYSQPGALHGAAVAEWLKQQEEQPGGEESESTWQKIRKKLSEGIDKLEKRADGMAARFREQSDPGADEATASDAASLETAAQGETEAPAEYLDPDRKREFDPAELVEQFKDQEFDNPQERLEAARESSAERFHDLHAQVRYVESLTETEPLSVNLEQYVNFTPSHDQVDEFQEKFAQTLADPGTGQREKASILAEINREAEAYTRGDLWEEEMRHFDFEQARELDGYHVFLQTAMEDRVKANWHAAHEAVKDLRKETADDASREQASGVIHAANALQNSYVRSLTEAVRNDDEEQFNFTADNMNSHSHAFAYAVRENAGFVIAEDYQTPGLRDEFRIPLEAQLYFRIAERAAEELEGNINPFHQEAVRQIIQDSVQHLEQWRREPDSEQIHEQLHLRARAVNYLLQPKREREDATAK